MPAAIISGGTQVPGPYKLYDGQTPVVPTDFDWLVQNSAEDDEETVSGVPSLVVTWGATGRLSAKVTPLPDPTANWEISARMHAIIPPYWSQLGYKVHAGLVLKDPSSNRAWMCGPNNGEYLGTTGRFWESQVFSDPVNADAGTASLPGLYGMPLLFVARRSGFTVEFWFSTTGLEEDLIRGYFEAYNAGVGFSGAPSHAGFGITATSVAAVTSESPRIRLLSWDVS